MNSKEINLHNAIHTSIKLNEICDFFENALLVNDRTKVRHRDETEFWDYKEYHELNDKLKVAKLAKQILAFHNNKGGCLIFGVRDDYVAKGVAANSIYDTNALRSILRKYIGDIPIFQGSIPSYVESGVIWLIFISI